MQAEADSLPEYVVRNPDMYWMSSAKLHNCELLDIIDEYVSEPGLTVDVGTDDGYFAGRLKQETGADVIATDINQEALQKAEENGVTYVLSDGTEAITEGSADCITYISSLQAMRPREELESAYRALDEGIVLITGPTHRTAEIFPEDALDYSVDPPAIEVKFNGLEPYSQRFFPEGWIEETATEIGFEVLEKSEIGIDLRGLPKLHDILKPEYRPEVDEDLLEQLRQMPDETMGRLAENPEKAPKAGMWVLKKSF